MLSTTQQIFAFQMSLGSPFLRRLPRLLLLPLRQDLTKAESSSDQQLSAALRQRATSHFQVKYGVMDYTSGKLMRLSSLWMDDIIKTTMAF